ncbi:cytochrome P450 9G3, partial [Danaus plexippus plexippus]
SWFLKSHFLDDLDSVYKAFPEERYVGYIEGTTKTIIIRDPEITKNITVKDFQHFTDHKTFFSEETEPLFGGSLFSMKDLMRRYTNDVIASAAFGLQVNSVEDRDNEFFNIGRDLFSFTFFQRFYMIFVALFPNFTKVHIEYLKTKKIKLVNGLNTKHVCFRIWVSRYFQKKLCTSLKE